MLDKNDFKCLAVRNTIVESKGEFPADRFSANAKIMDDLWNEIAELADFDKNGENSDHLMVKMIPLNSVDNHVTKVKKKIIYRPLSDEGFKRMTLKLSEMDWEFIEDIDEVEFQTKMFQDTLFSIFDDCFPQKVKVVSNRDEPFYNDKLRKVRGCCSCCCCI